MLPLPNLDDRMFEQIVLEARKSIPRLLPRWTDENVHDPGITFVELFAWLSEMQQYYLNRVTHKNELKFLKLLGIHLADAVSARADIAVSDVKEEIILPKGTKLLAADQAFETEEQLLLLPAKIDKLIVRSQVEGNDMTSSNDHEGVSFYAFGTDTNVGSRLYIGFDRELPLGKSISLTVKLFDHYPVQMAANNSLIPSPFIPSAKVSWKFYGTEPKSNNPASGWLPLPVIKDETIHLSHSGRVIFRLPVPMKAMTIHPANDRGRFWICCTLEEDGYEVYPKIDNISLNAVSVIQQDTLSETLLFDSSGKGKQIIEFSDHVSFYGNIVLQVKNEAEDWQEWKEVMALAASGVNDFHYELMKDAQTKSTIIAFGDGIHGAIPLKGLSMIRIIAYIPDFLERRLVGKSNGLPNQAFRTDFPNILKQSFKLQVSTEKTANKAEIWQDWTLVDDFDLSTSSDRHYMLDAETGELHFGNNEKGIIPSFSADLPNICIISCQIGGGTRGNVKKNLIEQLITLTPELSAVKVTNSRVAAGGQERETIQDAKRRVQKQLHHPYRAVTNEDYELIAKSTPGLRVARVKAIPLFKLGLKDYPNHKAPGQITVVVVPYSEAKKPIPSKGFLNTVKHQLDRHRLITTEIHVIAPEYIKITVHAVVAVEAHLRDEADKIMTALNEYIQPLDHHDHYLNHKQGWEFGRTVYKGDIYGEINRIQGVEYVQDLWLSAEGTGLRKEANGDIHIPPHGLVYSGEHIIEIRSPLDI
ncbi:MAG: putative baseplate assembly protein [Bacilli bacterium]|nr:putative baseplate assembly protein [Bacilli bacterium]